MVQAGRSAGSRVLTALREMIVAGELLPGQTIRQDAMSKQLDVSRLPLREALGQLVAEGLARHEHNVGYTVTRLDEFEFHQVYLLRGLLESAILERVEKPTRGEEDSLRGTLKAVEVAALSVDTEGMQVLNRQFHFQIFELSRLPVLVSELGRVWTQTAPYHAFYFADEAARTRVLNEHRELFRAAVDGDGARLVRLMEAHRDGGEWSINSLLKRTSPTGPTLGVDQL